MPNTIQESIKTQFQFSATENNTATPQSILPTTNTILKQSLEAKYPTAVISSYLEIKFLELRIKISSVNEWIPPASSLSGTGAPVEVNRDLVRSLWDGSRKQMDIYHKLGTSPARLRGSISLLNKGDVYLYYLEDFLGVLTNQSAYPVTEGEDILIALSDAGYGFLQGTDEILFTGNFTHYLTITNDAYLTVNGGVVELATFDQAQAILGLLGTGTDNTPILNTISALQANLTTRLNTLDNALIDLDTKLDELLINTALPSNNGITKNYNPASSFDDLIYLMGTDGGTVAYANPHPSKIAVSASSILIGTVPLLTDRLDGDFLTTNTANSWVQIDLNTGRTVELTGVGLRSRVDNNAHPSSVVIEGSNNGTNFTPIEEWDSIGHTEAYQWRFTTFAKSPSYRYIRIRQPGLNTSGTNFFGVSEIALYGTLSAL